MKKGKPGLPGNSDYPTLYKEAFALDAEHLDQQGAFVKLKVYTGTQWRWVHFPVKYSRFHQIRLQEAGWEQQSPSLILRTRYAALHIPQVKAITAKKAAVSALETHQQEAMAIRHTRQRRAQLPPKINPGKGSKSHRLNRKLANQIRGLVRDYAKEQAFQHGTVTVEVNPHGTSQYCSRCGARGERFSLRGSERVRQRGGKLFGCPRCRYQANADFNASVNVHRSFYREYHWEPKPGPPGRGGHTP